MAARRGVSGFCEINGLNCPTGQTTPIDTQEKKPELPNRYSDPGPEKVDAEPRVRGHGAGAYDCSENLTDFQSDNTSKPDPFARLEHFPDHAVRSAKMLAYGLTLKTVDGWQLARAIWQARLGIGELEAMVITALRALPVKNAQSIAASFLDCFRGPLLPLVGEQTMAEARIWAAGATRRERKAAMWASWETLDERDRAAFLDAVARRAAA